MGNLNENAAPVSFRLLAAVGDGPGAPAARRARVEARSVFFAFSRRSAFASRLALFALPLLMLVGMMGCSSSFNPKLGSITVTSPGGGSGAQVTSVIVNDQLAVTVQVIGEQPSLGVDWNLTCLGSSVASYTANPCGTLDPVHVGSNISMLYTAPLYVPLANTVTLTAQITSDPSQQSSITLTILPQPVAIAFTGTAPPAQIGASGMAAIVATVTNDNLAKGVSWTATCGSSSCGTLTPAVTASGDPTTYTAPATIPSGGSVKITAASIADPTKSVSLDISIEPISVTVSPQTVTVPAQGTADLTAMVAFDTFNAGVMWEDPVCNTAGACGTIKATGPLTATYTAPSPKLLPSGGKVTVTAKSVTDPRAAATVKITIGKPIPIVVTVSAASNLLQLTGSTTVTANVANDYNNAGVSWSCLPGICSPDISPTAPFQTTYTAPATAAVGALLPVKAISNTDNTKSGTTFIKVAAPISVNITTVPSTVTAGSPSAFSATVTNDVGTGGVDWSASNCGGPTNCGTFDSGNPNSPNHSASGAKINYIPPLQLPATTVTITATSTASQTVTPVKSATATTTVIPVPYARFIPFAPSILPLGNTASPVLVTLIAVAANDTSNEGVHWSVCSSIASCGAFLKTPGLPPATVKGQPVLPVYSAALDTASGQAVSYLPPTEMPSGGTVTITATANVNPTATTSQVITIASDTTGVAGAAVQGKVMAGTLGVNGATVQLFAAGSASGSAGYGSAATPLVINSGSTEVTTATDGSGSFSIPAGYICPSQSTELYLVAQGGAVNGAKNNAQLGMMTALGPCSNLNSTIPVIVNEVTTVATIWALAPFTGVDYAHIGSSSTNYTTGFANAFNTINNIVDITKGQAYTNTPAGYGMAPQAEINTLADAIDLCAASSGGVPGDGSACGTLFEDANLSPACGAVQCAPPTNILQAILEVAEYPNSNYATPTPGSPIFNLLPTGSAAASLPFEPILQQAPLDWSLAISFTGGGLGGMRLASPQSDAMAIDAAGNVWIANRHISSVTELSNLGAPLSPFTTGTTLNTAGGYPGGGLNQPEQIAIDLVGNAWILNSDSSLTELAYNGAPAKGSPFKGGGTATANGMVIDGSGDVWVTDAGPPGDVAKYAGYNSPPINGNTPANGTVLSPKGGYVNGITSPNGAIAVDGAGTVWVLNQGNYSAAELNSSNGALNQVDFGYIANSSGVPIEPKQSILSASAFGTTMAIDGSGVNSQGKPNGTGNVYIPNPNAGGTAEIYELLYGGSTENDGGIGQLFSVGELPATGPTIAIDGSGHLWLMTYANTSNGQPPALSQLANSGGLLDNSLTAPGLTGPNTDAGAAALAVDNAGNIWVLIQTGSSTVTEFIGVASPAVTPLAQASASSSLGKRP